LSIVEAWATELTTSLQTLLRACLVRDAMLRCAAAGTGAGRCAALNKTEIAKMQAAWSSNMQAVQTAIVAHNGYDSPCFTPCNARKHSKRAGAGKPIALIIHESNDCKLAARRKPRASATRHRVLTALLPAREPRASANPRRTCTVHARHGVLTALLPAREKEQ